MTPQDANKRVKNLGTQECFAKLLDVGAANFSRYLRGDDTQMSHEKQKELDRILKYCELAQISSDPFPLSFRDPVKVSLMLDHIDHCVRLYKSFENQESNPFLHMYPEPLSTEIQSL